ncbi:MAG: hypothetical protein AAF806_28070 [Bacteroidota bacterium]
MGKASTWVLGFLVYGLPKHLQTDHASVFYGNNSHSLVTCGKFFLKVE